MLAAVIGLAASASAATVNLPNVIAAKTLNNGDIVTGTLGGNYKLSIAAGATITLRDATIVPNENWHEEGNWAGLSCVGDAIIILEGTNTVKGFRGSYRSEPGIFIPSGNTLIIRGDGVLNATGSLQTTIWGPAGPSPYYGGIGGATGIGGCCHFVKKDNWLDLAPSPVTCGNIVIEGGIIFATGDGNGAGIGSGPHNGVCGDITITGGSVTAQGAGEGMGIGTGKYGVCGDITITGGRVTASGYNRGIGGFARNSCGNITIGSGITSVTAIGRNHDYNPIGVGRDDDDDAIDVAFGLTDTTLKNVDKNDSSEKRSTRTIDHWDGNLAVLTDGRLVPDGKHLYGECPGLHQICIASNATVTLAGVTIRPPLRGTGKWAGLTCEGDAQLVLEGYNEVEGFGLGYPGIYVPVDKTLTITGGGTLDVHGFGSGAAGIGGGKQMDCGNIVIRGGVINSSGLTGAAGIGGGENASCGTIFIDKSISRINSAAGDFDDGVTSWNNPIGAGFYGRGGAVTVAEGLIDSTRGNTRTITWNGDLSTRICGATIFKGMRIYGTLPGNYKLSIENNAQVTLDGVTINGVNNADCMFAGLTCEGNAVIILEEGSVNTVRGFYEDYPGIHVPANKRLVINGRGSLTASSNGYGAGIGGGWGIDCGNILIEEGSVTAIGGSGAAGIGGGQNRTCGTIEVAAGITRVVAENSGDTNPIGPGRYGSGGATTIAPGLSDTPSGTRRTIIPQWDGNLSTLSDDVTAYDGVTITGTLHSKNQICIAAGATVTLKRATILFDDVAKNTSYSWAGLTCLGDATIILEGNNFVRGFYEDYPGIYVPSGCTLTIKGSGMLDADSNGYGAGVGGGYNVSCGNIDIQSGWVYASGGRYAAGIGGGYNVSCGNIHIGAGVAKVVATRGEDGLYPLGSGSGGTGGEANFGEGLTVDRDGATWTITWGGDLSVLSGDVTAVNGTVIHGTLPGNYKVSIAANATVTLSDVTIAGVDDYQYKWAGITCLGDATILVEGANVVRGFYHDYPGIYVPTNKTLTIRGVGALGDASLHASSGGEGAGIGGGFMMGCGNIYIARCIVNAAGGGGSAGIGGGRYSRCGNITISSGVITAVAGVGYAAGIGSGTDGSCGTIWIGSSVSLVKATSHSTFASSIGAGSPGSCDAVTVEGVGNCLTDTTEGRTRTIIWNGDLSKVTGDRIAFDGMKLYNVVYGYYPKISIDDGATVTISNATINGMSNDAYRWAGLTCMGDATIVLEGSNSLRGFYEDYPGIYVPTNKTLTIEGEGSLAAGSNGYGAGIGSGFRLPSGNIVIKGGTITANGGSHAAAGIGGVNSAACGSIAVKGGTVNATGGNSAPGIGALQNSVRCESIEIGPGIARVTATRSSGWTQNPIYDGRAAFTDVPDGLRDETSNDGDTRTIYSYWNGDLSQLESDMTVPDGMTVYGELQGDYNLSIEAGATVTLSNAVINGEDYGSYCSTLFCLGDAKLILQGANYVSADGYSYPGIFVPADSTLEIDGDGSLEVEGGAAGIGGISNPSLDDTGRNGACGNIIIRGGRIVATGGYGSAGIGGSLASDCGDIQILGGEVWATGGGRAAGIGGGYGNGSIGNVEIGEGIHRVVATAGEDDGDPIGSGNGGTIGYISVDPRLPDDHLSPTRTIYPRWNGDLSALDGDMMAVDGTTVHGEMLGGYKVLIEAGATVTLSNAVISGRGDDWAGLTCMGDAHIILVGTNYLCACDDDHPGIFIPAGSTLEIDGDGYLEAVGGCFAAGIGGLGDDASERDHSCGDIVIRGGKIVAMAGDEWAAGIGGSGRGSCGNIWILGGDVRAIGGYKAPGIGGGGGSPNASAGSVGDIYIGSGVFRVVAVCGENSSTPIGAGYGGSVGSIDIHSDLRDDHGVPKRVIGAWDGDLSTLDGDVTIGDGMLVFGTFPANSLYKISIAAGATVTLSNAYIYGVHNDACRWAGLNCEGDATLILVEVNHVYGFHNHYPGILVPENHTLTIDGIREIEDEGESDLTVCHGQGSDWKGYGAGIGGGLNIPCGNIWIKGGLVEAYGGLGAAAIGGGRNSSFGNIRIDAGCVRANAKDGGAGIGSGSDCRAENNTYGDITITGGDVSACVDEYSNGAGIGCGVDGVCGSIAITGGEVYAEGGTESPGIGSDGARNDVRLTITIGAGVESVKAVRGSSFGEDPIFDGASAFSDTPAGMLDETNGRIRTIKPDPHYWDGNLDTVTENVTAVDGTVIYGTLTGNYKVSIAAGAAVTLSNAVINGVNTSSCKWAGLTCDGNATIILKETNTIKGFYEDYPGIHVPVGSTLTISGTGSLDASSNGYGAGIGGGLDIGCGSINIYSGTVTAAGGYNAAGIGGGGDGASCGSITIGDPSSAATGHATVTATGGDNGAGIGSGFGGSCGAVIITGSQTQVNATGGTRAAGIGSGYNGGCGAVSVSNGITSVTATCGNDCSNPIGAGKDGAVTSVTIDSSLSETTSDDGKTRTITGSGSSSGYTAWATANGVSGAWNATDANGIHNVFRYAFNKPTGAFTEPPLLDIAFNAAGKAVIITPPLVNSAGFTFTIEASDSAAGTGNTASYGLSASGETVIDETGKTTRFFRLKAVEQ